MQTFSALLINLDKDAERRDHMERQLSLAGISYTRQPGILGDAIPDDLRPYFFDENGAPKTTMKRGEIGCYASHLMALQRIASGALGDAVLVMEDDLAFEENCRELIKEAQRLAPSGWDILRLSSPSRRAFVPVAKIDERRVVARYFRIPMSAGAYLVTPKGAQKFLARGVRGLTFDDDLRRPWFHEMETFGVLPPVAHAGVLKSSIDSIEAGRFDKGMSSRMERLRRGDHFYAFRRACYNVRTLGVRNWALCVGINLVEMVVKKLFKRSVLAGAGKIFLK